MLVQGWGDRVRVFPAVPDHWRDVAFRDLLTEGAFRVSAVRQDGRTVWVRVRATVDRRLRLRDPFAGEGVVGEGSCVRREGDDLIADLKAGQEVTMTRPGPPIGLGEAVEAAGSGGVPRFGLRAH